jgi:hypothetical protein
MADNRTHNQPSHEAQVKGGQHSHQGKQHDDPEVETQSSKQTPPSREEASKGGQHSQAGSHAAADKQSGAMQDEEHSSGSSKRTPPSREEAAKGGHNSHSGHKS